MDIGHTWYHTEHVSPHLENWLANMTDWSVSTNVARSYMIINGSYYPHQIFQCLPSFPSYCPLSLCYRQTFSRVHIPKYES